MPSVAGVAGNALPFSGPLDLASINAEWGLGADLTQYHGVKWYYDGNLTFGYFSSGVNSIKISDFYGKRATDPASGGAYFANVSGSFSVPLYRNSITIEIWGAGGGGGSGNGGGGGKGGDSSALGVITGGGAGGGSGSIPVPPPPLDTATSGSGGRETVESISYVGGAYGIQGQTVTSVNGVVTGTVSWGGVGTVSVQVGDPAPSSEPSTCFVAGTPVMMYDRTYKSIEQIKVGDRVMGAFGEINTVLLLRHTFIGNRYMYMVNDEHLTTEDHMHVSSDKKFYSFNPERQKKSWNKWLPVLDQTGKEIEYFNLGFELDRLNKLELGIELQTVNGGKRLVTAEKLTYANDTPLFNLIVDGSHTYTANGYAVVGGPREDDFNYDTWMIKD